MIADPAGGSGDGGSPVSWVVYERGLELMRERELDWGHGSHKKERETGGGRGGGGVGAEGIWFGASRASFLACCIPGDQHRGVSFHPQPTSTTMHPNSTSIIYISTNID